MSIAPVADPLFTLREYRQLAPWNLRDLAAVGAAILDASDVRPINAAASPHPNERTIRFYVTRGIVSPPDGRGTAATYSYRHLLQVLAIKLRQMEGGTLVAIAQELRDQTGDMLERRVAAALGAGLPAPARLSLKSTGTPPRGRAGRALRSWIYSDGGHRSGRPGESTSEAVWHRIQVIDGVELHIHGGHPLAQNGLSGVADVIRRALTAGGDESEPGNSPAAGAGGG